MATKDTPTGLLARVANFVRSPAVDAPPENVVAPAEQGDMGKLAIKRMIERKAHNDAVRQREFRQLRKLREASPAALSEMAARASFYQDSSGFSEPEGRASTLKKIDEIEAQMSKQWWNGQQRKLGESAPPIQKPVATSALPVSVSASGNSRPSTVTAESQLDTCNTFAPTLPTHLDEPALRGLTKGNMVDKPRGSTWSPPGFPGFEATDYNGFSNSNVVSVELGQALSDPVLEDAAIRFANSDDTGAESVLILALKGQDVPQESKDAWTLALLDLYQSTGQQALYDRLLLDDPQRLDRLNSPPSLTARPSGTAAPTGQIPPNATTCVVWRSPTALDRASVEALQAAVVNRHIPVRLDWQSLKTITPEAAVALAALIAQWCDQTLVLQFDNLARLDGLLRLNTTLGDKDVPQFWWDLRLNVLRVLGSQEEFELVSMDYCMTYDISPPTWQRARCQRAFDLSTWAPVAHTELGETLDPTVAAPLTTRSAFVGADANCIELVGEQLGTVASGLEPLQKALQATGDLLVNCERLVRVDFSAAGSVLNWVASAQMAGKKVEFAQLPHLVAAFFNLIGINQHARVTTRNN